MGKPSLITLIADTKNKKYLKLLYEFANKENKKIIKFLLRL